MSIEINITENIVEVTPTEQQVDINITENPIEVNVTDEIVLIQQTGLPGPQGPAGQGVPIGGTTGQILSKNSATNYDTLWINNAVGTVTSIATTAPITGGTITASGTIGITQASASGNGYLSSTDWNTFNNKQNALTNPITGTGTVNYVPKFTGASALGNSNIQDSGSLITLGTAVQATSTSIFNNSMALGTALQTNSLFFINKSLGGNTFANGISIGSPVSSAVTALARYFNASTSTDAGFTLTELINYNARQGNFLSPVVDQIGFNVESTMSGATNNYAFRGNINFAARSWNFYANGTALNFMRGALLVGSTVDDTINKLQITGSAIVSSSITANSFIKSGGTSAQILAADGSVITAGTNITISGGTISAAGGGTVTSVGLTMPAAFAVANSPITGAGTLAVTAIGTASQYIRGDGSLATIPSTSSGGSSVNYYLNGSVTASVAGYKQMSNSAIIGAGTDFTLVGNGLIAQFLTDVANPNRLLIPGGAWNFEMFFNMSSGGGNAKFYVELLKYNGTTFTSIASSSTNPEAITGGTSTDLYLTSLSVPETILLTTDRLAVRVYIVDNSGGRTITLHTEDNNLCEIITTFAGGIAALNGLTANTQYLSVGTAGTDFAISSVTDTHTFNLPTASAANRGALSSTDWTTFNGKQNAITLTTTGTSGAATLVGSTLNIPQYSVGGSMAIGGSITSATAGSVLFAGTSGVLAQDNANFFWDDTNNRLGIGNAAPTRTLDITGTAIISGNTALSAALNVTGVTTLTDIAAIGTAVTQNNLNINRVITGAVTANGIQISSQVAGTVTTAARYFSAIASTAAGTLTELFNFRAAQGTFTGTVTTQYGYAVEATLIGATNNYGFRGAIPSGANRWNLYMDGTAINYINGSLLIGTTTDNGVDKLQINGSMIATTLKKSGGTSAQILAADGSVITAGTNITITGGTISAAGGGTDFYTTNGTLTSARTITAAGFGLTYSDNKNGQAAITISNTTAGTTSAAGLIMTSDATSGNGLIAKVSSTYTTSALVTTNDLALINYTAGDIIVLNTFATGLIKFGVGTSTSAQMTMTNDGHLLIGTTTNGTYFLDVNGNTNIGGCLFVTYPNTLRASINFATGGTLRSLPLTGDMEMDGTGKLYFTHNDTERGVIPAYQFFKPNAIISLVSQTAAQPIFNTITNGAVSLKSATNYLFEVLLYITGMSTTSGTFGFAIGGTATFSTIAWQSLGSKVNNIATTAAHQSTFNVTTSNATLVTASAFTTGYVRIWGSCRVAAGGTFIPQISLGIAAAASINPQSYFTITALSASSVDYIGNWS